MHAQLSHVPLEDAPAPRGARALERHARAARREERQAFRAALAALHPGTGQAVRLDGVPPRLRGTVRGRIRAAQVALGRDFVVRARGRTIWVLCAEDDAR